MWKFLKSFSMPAAWGVALGLVVLACVMLSIASGMANNANRQLAEHDAELVRIKGTYDFSVACSARRLTPEVAQACAARQGLWWSGAGGVLVGLSLFASAAAVVASFSQARHAKTQADIEQRRFALEGPVLACDISCEASVATDSNMFMIEPRVQYTLSLINTGGRAARLQSWRLRSWNFHDGELSNAFDHMNGNLCEVDIGAAEKYELPMQLAEFGDDARLLMRDRSYLVVALRATYRDRHSGSELEAIAESWMVSLRPPSIPTGRHVFLEKDIYRISLRDFGLQDAFDDYASSIS